MSFAGDCTEALPEPPESVTSTVYSPSESPSDAGVFSTPSAKHSAGIRSERNTSVRSYHFSRFLLNAAQSTGTSRDSTGTVNV